ncbi:MAG TPA: cysteine--tRNA ligase [Stellaceae bacterium]|nr:cysteine--tRNA ligase [Stellaceae bacterium]
MSLVLYNSLTRRKDRFEPLERTSVRLYVCGPTVYDRAHIGNARAFVVFDVLYRLLRDLYGREHVRYVRNITDVDDKIIAAVRDNGEPIPELTARTTAAFHEDLAALDTLPPDVEPRATAHVPQMIAMIERLIAKGHAYEAEGHVLFAVASDPDYGQLARRSPEEMLAGARVEVAPYKRDPGDFVLWKPSPPDLPGWDSPWGRGRPGWHIECSAMSEAHLGESFDIHGGGLDLIFPHHENELAQSTCAHDGRPFVRFWVHNGFLTVDGAKMSKSLGNFRTVREVLDEGVPGEAIRLALLSTHYRDPLDWTADKLRQARLALDRFYRALTLPRDPVFERFGEAEEALAPVRAALEDDLNTPLALSELHELTARINRTSSDAERSALQTALEQGGRLMGLLAQNPLDWLQGTAPILPLQGRITAGSGGRAQPSLLEPEKERIEKRIAARMEMRRQRRYAEADRIRAELATEGIVLEDKPDGTTSWRKE